MLKQPFETDDKSNIIDYNWHVDGILKNSQSYNKESANEKKEQPVAKKITKEDQLPVVLPLKAEQLPLNGYNS
jgi:hypothetical protein